MKLKLLLYTIAVLSANYTTAQVLFNETFNNLTLGKLTNDPTAATPGQNGWYVNEVNNKCEILIVAEPNKGNVAYIKPTANAKIGEMVGAGLQQKDIYSLWNKRNTGNNILHVQFEYYYLDEIANSSIELLGTNNIDNNTPIFNLLQGKNLIDVLYRKHNATGVGQVSRNPHKLNTWISVEIFLDYNSSNIYLYIPYYNILEGYLLYNSDVPYKFRILDGFYASSLNVGIKYDNIKISAIGNLPSYLGVDDFISSKFNVFPNPVKDLITITNNENIGIQQLEIFDIHGRNVKSKRLLNNEILTQLNIYDLTSGTYILHIKTKDGTAIKKIIKE